MTRHTADALHFGLGSARRNTACNAGGHDPAAQLAKRLTRQHAHYEGAWTLVRRLIRLLTWLLARQAPTWRTSARSTPAATHPAEPGKEVIFAACACKVIAVAADVGMQSCRAKENPALRFLSISDIMPLTTDRARPEHSFHRHNLACA